MTEITSYKKEMMKYKMQAISSEAQRWPENQNCTNCLENFKIQIEKNTKLQKEKRI